MSVCKAGKTGVGSEKGNKAEPSGEGSLLFCMHDAVSAKSILVASDRKTNSKWFKWGAGVGEQRWWVPLTHITAKSPQPLGLGFACCPRIPPC